MKHFKLNSFSVNQPVFKKIPLARKLKSELSITPLIAGFLAACADSSRLNVDPDSPLDFSTFSVRVVDGPLRGAQIFIDTDNDGQFTEADEVVCVTDANGVALVSRAYINEDVFAFVGGAVDIYTGKVLPDSIYRGKRFVSESGDLLLSPLTALVEEFCDDGVADADIIDVMFGSNSGIELEDLYQIEFYEPPTETPEEGSQEALIKMVADMATRIQVLAEMRDNNFKTVYDELFGGTSAEDPFDPVDDLSDEETAEVNERIEDTQETLGGRPVAAPLVIEGNNRVVIDSTLDEAGALPNSISFAGGADIYEIYASLAADVTISDTFNSETNRNLVIFDDSVGIASYVINQSGSLVFDIEITLNNAAGNVVTLEGPVGSFDYQVGSAGPVWDYQEFIDYLALEIA